MQLLPKNRNRRTPDRQPFQLHVSGSLDSPTENQPDSCCLHRCLRLSRQQAPLPKAGIRQTTAEQQQIEQIKLCTAKAELLLVTGTVQSSANGAAHHATGTENREAVVGVDQAHSRAPTTSKPLRFR